MSEKIARDASRRKCLLFAVAVLRDDLPLLETVVQRIAAEPHPHPRSWELPTWFPELPAAISVVERAADGEATPDEEHEFRETWLRVKEAAVMDQDFEVAVYFRDAQDILRRVDPEFPRRPPYHVRAARELNRGSLAGHSSLHIGASEYDRAREGQRAIEARWQRYEVYRTDVFGPAQIVPFSADWCTDTAVSLAKQMYESREFSAMPILADALQDAGCDNDDVLNHCRDANQTHVRGCWVVDLVLGKE
jgi:hypothetical protein